MEQKLEIENNFFFFFFVVFIFMHYSISVLLEAKNCFSSQFLRNNGK